MAAQSIEEELHKIAVVVESLMVDVREGVATADVSAINEHLATIAENTSRIADAVESLAQAIKDVNTR